ncbi:hypothetical protein MRS76_07670 [Rhizobiaceae bacterium n13]|uniref:N-acetyltransferase domain-containing protein n=1 Tax=Ferirhizobium litorale TaxID=2927786 RepID=A0AAE3QD83_9HYPH|nr:hypothetical protein [Fererhizobium litorale]MDI7861833.1 hypothetical protein [Fererhizobium litorale]MDI7921825.1 hypothetical protein [Fererhizobium litorale]
MQSTLQKHGAGAQAPRGGIVRPVEHRDLVDVAALFQKTFRNSRDPAPASLIEYFGELFLNHPWLDDGLRSKVYLDADGAVAGFLGIVPARMKLGDLSITAAYAGSYMVDRPQDNPLVGARLLRAFLSGPQDLFVSETANSIALGMWQKLGHHMEPSYSLNWLRMFGPARAAIDLAAHKVAAARLLAPIGAATDWAIDRALRKPLAPAKPDERRYHAEDADVATLAPVLQQLSETFALRPDWKPEVLDWLLAHASRKALFGDIHCRVLRAPDGEPAGCAVYYGRPGAIAWVLQLLATPGAIETVVDDMLFDAYGRGCAGIRGNGDPQSLPVLMNRKTLFFSRSVMLVSSRNPAILSELRSGRALVTGLAGESWCRMIGDTFT